MDAENKRMERKWLFGQEKVQAEQPLRTDLLYSGILSSDHVMRDPAVSIIFDVHLSATFGTINDSSTECDETFYCIFIYFDSFRLYK